MTKYKTILVVDDNPAILTAVKICLEGVFERVLTLTDPNRMLSTLQQEAVEVVLLDMNFVRVSTPGRRDCSGCAPCASSIRTSRWY